MNQFIKKYYVVLVIMVAFVSYIIYQSMLLTISYNQDLNDPRFSATVSGPYMVSIFMGSIGDTGKCDTLIQVKRGIQEANPIDGSLKKLFEGPLYSEETVVVSAFKDYDKIYNGITTSGTTVFVDFKYDLIDPNSNYFKDFTKPCTVSQLNQIIFTVKQFKEIQNVVVSVDGSPRKFMQARQFNCDLEANQVRYEKECLTKIP
jgi:hypothetical protein